MKATIRFPFPEVTEVTEGAPGVVAGSAFTTGEPLPDPSTLTARMLTGYVVPLVRFVSLSGPAMLAGERVVHVSPPSTE